MVLEINLQFQIPSWESFSTGKLFLTCQILLLNWNKLPPAFKFGDLPKEIVQAVATYCGASSPLFYTPLRAGGRCRFLWVLGLGWTSPCDTARTDFTWTETMIDVWPSISPKISRTLSPARRNGYLEGVIYRGCLAQMERTMQISNTGA